MRLSIRVGAIKYYLLTLTRKTLATQVPDSFCGFPLWSSHSSAIGMLLWMGEVLLSLS